MVRLHVVLKLVLVDRTNCGHLETCCLVWWNLTYWVLGSFCLLRT